MASGYRSIDGDGKDLSYHIWSSTDEWKGWVERNRPEVAWSVLVNAVHGHVKCEYRSGVFVWTA